MELTKECWSLKIPWNYYQEADPHNFDWMRFSKVDFHGYTLYLTFHRPGHRTLEIADHTDIIHCRCYIHTEEIHRQIRAAHMSIMRFLRWQGCNKADHAIYSGLLNGCFEWEFLGDWERAEREREYAENPPEEYFDDETQFNFLHLVEGLRFDKKKIL